MPEFKTCTALIISKSFSYLQTFKQRSAICVKFKIETIWIAYLHSSCLNKLAANEIEFLRGVVRTVFDNEQVVGKRYRVKADQSTIPSSGVSSSIYLCIDKTSNIQSNESLRPVHWMFQPVDEISL